MSSSDQVRNDRESSPMKKIYFPCREPGCTGRFIRNHRKNGGLIVSYHEHENHCARTVRCPRCGRLHWPETGNSVTSSDGLKLFWIKTIDGKGKIVRRTLSSLEKSLEIQKAIVSLLPEGIHRIQQHLTSGHSRDCTANIGGRCICGFRLATEYASLHEARVERLQKQNGHNDNRPINNHKNGKVPI